MNSELKSIFLSAIQKFNEHDFYACHDLMEDVWFKVRGDDRDFYQGLIHLAVGFYHITEKKNPKGALLQLNKAIKKLTPFKPKHEGVELKELIVDVKKSLNRIEKINMGKMKKFNLKSLPKMQILNY